RRGVHGGGDCDFDAGIFEPVSVDVSTGVFRDGGGWRFPFGSGASECADASAGGGDSAGKFADDGGGAGGKLRCDSGLCGVDGRVVFWAECAGAVCFSAASNGGGDGGGVSSAGASVDY